MHDGGLRLQEFALKKIGVQTLVSDLRVPGMSISTMTSIPRRKVIYSSSSAQNNNVRTYSTSISDDVSNILRREDGTVVIGSVFRKLHVVGNSKREAVGIDDVPVESRYLLHLSQYRFVNRGEHDETYLHPASTESEYKSSLSST